MLMLILGFEIGSVSETQRTKVWVALVKKLQAEMQGFLAELNDRTSGSIRREGLVGTS
jgi:hypothetical protein